MLMSTYNGELYIDEQIQSILSQKDVDLNLLIRDDASKDNTIEKIKKYTTRDNVSFYNGKNIGATRSFFDLMNHAGEYEYYCLSDQDDVWDDDKVITAVNKLLPYSDQPALYSSNTRLVDSNLNVIKNEDKSPKCTLGSAIVKNYCTGCTVVFNSELIKLLKEKTPDDVQCHDWWINLVTLANDGVSIFDEEPHISYRQHGNNVTGSATSFVSKWKFRLKKFREPGYRRDKMARDLLTLYPRISKDNITLLKMMENPSKNLLQIIRSPELTTGDLTIDALFRFLVASNKY